MGGCFSKPARPHAKTEGPAQQQSPNVPSVTATSTAPAAEPTQGKDQDIQQLSAQQASPATSAQLPTVLEAWSPADVLTWAAGLGLGPTAAGALQVRACGVCLLYSSTLMPRLCPAWQCTCDRTAWCAVVWLLLSQGCSGQQLVQLTDKGLLQLGVQDAAERQALLTARKNLQQQHQEQQLQLQQHQQQQQPTANGVEQAVLVLPAPGTPTAVGAGQGQQAPAGMEEVGAQDGQAGAEGSNKAGVRCVGMPRGLCGLQAWCGDCPASYMQLWGSTMHITGTTLLEWEIHQPRLSRHAALCLLHRLRQQRTSTNHDDNSICVPAVCAGLRPVPHMQVLIRSQGLQDSSQAQVTWQQRWLSRERRRTYRCCASPQLGGSSGVCC